MRIKIIRTESIYILRKRFDFVKGDEINLEDEFANLAILKGIAKPYADEIIRDKSPVEENKAILNIPENKKEEKKDEKKKNKKEKTILTKTKKIFKKHKKKR